MPHQHSLLVERCFIAAIASPIVPTPMLYLGAKQSRFGVALQIRTLPANSSSSSRSFFHPYLAKRAMIYSPKRNRPFRLLPHFASLILVVTRHALSAKFLLLPLLLRIDNFVLDFSG